MTGQTPVTNLEMLSLSRAALMPPMGAGRRWSFAAGTYSIRRHSGTSTSPNLPVSLNVSSVVDGLHQREVSSVLAGSRQENVQDLSGKVSEFRYLSAERLCTVPSSATTFVMHEMLREHIQLPVSCLVIFPVAKGLREGGEPKALRRLEPAEVLEAGLSYRRSYLCQDFRADVVDGSDPDAKSCEACGWMEWLCASCLMRTAVKGSGVFVHCLLCLADPDDHDEVQGQRVRAQLSALSPSQKAWLENFRRWLPKDDRDDSEMEEVD